MEIGKVLLLFFGIKISFIKHEVMLHAMSLNLSALFTAIYCVMSASP